MRTIYLNRHCYILFFVSPKTGNLRSIKNELFFITNYFAVSVFIINFHQIQFHLFQEKELLYLQGLHL